MNWIALFFAIFYSLVVIHSLRKASGQGEWKTYNATANAIGAILCAVIAGFSVYFWRSDLVPQMDWFFGTVIVWLILLMGVSIMDIGRHGQRIQISTGVYAFAAIIGTAVAAGFYYIFFVLTF